MAVFSDTIARGWAFVTVGSVVRIGLGFFTSILIVRALGPAEYGVYVLLVAAVNVVGGVADLGLSQAGVWRIASAGPDDADPAKERGQAFFWIRVGTAGLIGVALLLPADLLARHVLGLSGATGLFRWALLGAVVSAWSGAINAILQATGRFGRLSALLVFNALFILAAAGGLEAAGQLTVLAALIVLGILPSLLTFGAGVRLLPAGWRLSLPPPAALGREARHLFHFGKWLWLANLLAVLGMRVDLFFVSHWSDATLVVGLYGLARTLSLRAAVVNHSLYTVLLPAASGLHQAADIREYVRRALPRGALICALLLLFLPFAGPFVTLAYGSVFASAAPLLQGLLIAVMIEALMLPFLLLLVTYRRPRLVALVEGTRLFVVVALLPWLLPAYGLPGAVAAQVAGAVAAVVVLGCVFGWGRGWWMVDG
jgi:O-antigen/teichoic acid export membrane protein